MKALWQIILAILWRLRPVQALEANLAHVIQLCLGMFSDEDAIDDLTFDPAYSQTIAAAFFDAHRKVDLLIYMRACEIAGVRPRIDSFKPDFRWTHSSTNLIALWRSFQRLAAKFDDYERYAQRRAERLRREPDNLPLRLAATLQSTSPALCAVEANRQRPFNVQIASISAQHWGRWIGASSRRDGGGGEFARGPPHITRLPIAHSLLPRTPPARTPPCAPI